MKTIEEIIHHLHKELDIAYHHHDVHYKDSGYFKQISGLDLPNTLLTTYAGQFGPVAVVVFDDLTVHTLASLTASWAYDAIQKIRAVMNDPSPEDKELEAEIKFSNLLQKLNELKQWLIDNNTREVLVGGLSAYYKEQLAKPQE